MPQVLQRTRLTMTARSPRALEEVGQHRSVDHLLHLVGHARHGVDDLAAPTRQSRWQPGRGADRVRDDAAADGDVGLAQVVLGHVAAAGAEHAGDLVDELVVALERDAHHLGDRLPGDVVLGRAEAAADEHGVGVAERRRAPRRCARWLSPTLRW